MALMADATLEAFILRIISNEKIMNLMNLPTIYSNDDEKTKTRKRKVLIDKFINKTAQIPTGLGDEFKEIEIDNKKYSNYGKTRITVSFAQSIAMHNDIFGNPQVDINVYYDNTNLDNVFKIIDLISDEFSGQDLEIKSETENSFIRNIRCEGQTSQTAMINNYERMGIRFSFYATLYKN